MPFYNYTTGVPATNDNPSDDQPDMQVNTDSTASILAVDHFGFQNNDGGWHQQVTIPKRTAIPTVVANQGALYTKTANSATQLFYTPDASTNQYQITRTNAANFATFGTFTVYDGAKPNQSGGWSFLPGGLLMQYGTVSTATNGTVVGFPITFTNIFSVTGTRGQGNTGTTWGVSAVSNAGFTISHSSGSGSAFYWMAIGN